MVTFNKETADAALHAGANLVRIAGQTSPEPISAVVLKTIYAVYEEFQKISVCRSRCAKLGVKVKELEDAINNLRKTDIIRSMNAQKLKQWDDELEELYDFLKTVEEDVKTWAKYSRLRVWWNEHAVSKALSGFEKKLDETLELTTLKNTYRTAVQTTENGDTLKTLARTIEDVGNITKWFLHVIYRLAPSSNVVSSLASGAPPADITLYREPMWSSWTANIHLGLRFGGDSANIVGKSLKFQSSMGEYASKKLAECLKHFEQLEHPSVMKASSILSTSPPAIYVISTFQSNTNILEFCKRPGSDVVDYNLYSLLAQAADGLAHMHKANFVHGNVKSSNILITAEKRAVVHDFECARFLSDTSDYENLTAQQREQHDALSQRHFESSIRYMAPELVAGKDGPAIPESDVWAFGMVMIELITDKRPYASLRKPIEVMHAVTSHAPLDKPEPVRPWMSEDVWKLILECSAFQPERRATMASVAKKLRQLADGYISPRRPSATGSVQ
ncbi:kinase-like domain-containing protein [Cytidiella melzeri]|nr:kinase-like domain-containing protein [Cytidiella melzeri]